MLETLMTNSKHRSGRGRIQRSEGPLQTVYDFVNAANKKSSLNWISENNLNIQEIAVKTGALTLENDFDVKKLQGRITPVVAKKNIKKSVNFSDLQKRVQDQRMQVLLTLARFHGLMFNELRILSAPQLHANNFYPHLNFLIEHGFIAVWAYKIEESNGEERAFFQRAQIKKHTNRSGFYFQLSPIGKELLSKNGHRYIKCRLPNGEYELFKIEAPGAPGKHNRHHHEILISQFLAWQLYDFAGKNHLIKCEYSTDYLLSRSVFDMPKIPDALLFLVVDADRKYHPLSWIEIERARKKNHDLKNLVWGISYAEELNYQVSLVYPTNARDGGGNLINHSKLLSSAMTRYTKSRISPLFITYSLHNGNKLGGGNFEMIFPIQTYVPSLYSFIALDLDENWGTDYGPNKAGYGLLYKNFRYYMLRMEVGFQVGPVNEMVQKARPGYPESKYDEVNEEEIIEIKSDFEAKKRCAEYICKRYGEDKVLNVIKIYAPKTYKSYQNYVANQNNPDQLICRGSIEID